MREIKHSLKLFQIALYKIRIPNFVRQKDQSFYVISLVSKKNGFKARYDRLNVGVFRASFQPLYICVA